MTIHAAFALYDSLAQGRSKRAVVERNSYIPLSADTRNTLRNSMDNLFVVIIVISFRLMTCTSCT